ncbi:MAG: hypothetical protein Q6356_010710 [Candidatus Wukongarchaeota archaeon]|nr:hypothetical protein [Candidatus Wukongarchaeota archaeon]
MQFCDKCGKLLKPKKDKKGMKLVCPKCGYQKTGGEENTYKLIREVKHSPREEVITVTTPLKKRREGIEEEEREESYRQVLEFMEGEEDYEGSED